MARCKPDFDEKGYRQMDWLKRLMNGPQQKTTANPSQGQMVRIGGDEHYRANSDIVDGVHFIATLQIRTPLSVLMHHGDSFRGPPSQAPTYGTGADGIWLPKLRTFQKLGVNLREFESKHASDIGPVVPSDYLPFLIEFRTIIESDGAHGLILKSLDELRKQSPQNAKIWRKLKTNYEDFPRSFFYRFFTQIPGVGLKTAKTLYDAGYRSVDEIASAGADQLQKVGGLGPKTAAKVASYQQTL
jgi:hypothetical protein